MGASIPAQPRPARLSAQPCYPAAGSNRKDFPWGKERESNVCVLITVEGTAGNKEAGRMNSEETRHPHQHTGRPDQHSILTSTQGDPPKHGPATESTSAAVTTKRHGSYSTHRALPWRDMEFRGPLSRTQHKPSL